MKRAPLRRNGPIRQRPKTRKPPRPTGPSQRIRNLVLARDNWQCAGCGKFVAGAFVWWSLQHRKARGTGGGNEPSNLVVLCGTATSQGCHRLCEDRDPVMHERGLWVRSDENPGLVPVEYWDGRVAWLTDDGGLILEGDAA